MIRYKLYQDNRSNVEEKGKWYARAVCEETFTLETLARHMAAHNSPYSAGTIHGVLRDMVECTKELILDGKNVKLDGLAIFSLGLKTVGAPTAKDFTPQMNIKAVRLRARATGTLMTKQISGEAKTKQFTVYGTDEGEEKAPGQEG